MPSVSSPVLSRFEYPLLVRLTTTSVAVAVACLLQHDWVVAIASTRVDGRRTQAAAVLGQREHPTRRRGVVELLTSRTDAGLHPEAEPYLREVIRPGWRAIVRTGATRRRVCARFLRAVATARTEPGATELSQDGPPLVVQIVEGPLLPSVVWIAGGESESRAGEVVLAEIVTR